MIYVFDMFGVVVDWSSDYVVPQWAKYAKVSERDFRTKTYSAFQRCESGKMSMGSFWKALGLELKCDASGLEKILEKRFKAKAKLNEGVVKIVEELRKAGNTVVLLSNQLPVHGDWCRNNGWFDYFDRVFLSYEIGARKPAIGAYKAVIDALKVKPFDLFLVDDKAENVGVALSHKLNGVVYVSPAQLREDLQKLYRGKGVSKRHAI